MNRNSSKKLRKEGTGMAAWNISVKRNAGRVGRRDSGAAAADVLPY